MTAFPFFLFATVAAGTSHASSMVDRISGAMRDEVLFCDMPPPSLSTVSSWGDVGLAESVALRMEMFDYTSCVEREVSLLMDATWPLSVETITPIGECRTSFAVEHLVPALRSDAVPVAVCSGPCLLPRGVRCVADGVAAGIMAGIVFDGLCDESLPPRLPEWRPFLLSMLAGRVPTKDFDRAFSLLLGTFPGSDAGAKTSALLKWAAMLPLAKDSADVYRALTRHYIAGGEYDLAIGAADAMVGYHAGYLPNALYLKGHSHAFAGRFDEARQCLAKALALNPVGAAHARILYLQAWMFIQEGDVQAAAELLRDIVLRHPSTKYAKQARSILVSLEG